MSLRFANSDHQRLGISTNDSKQRMQPIGKADCAEGTSVGDNIGRNVVLTPIGDHPTAMIPMKHSTIFKSRWLALLWAAGIVWLAMQVAGPGDKPVKTTANGDTGYTDVTGHKVTSKDEEALKKAFENVKRLRS
jgi:hypothetical protein